MDTAVFLNEFDKETEDIKDCICESGKLRSWVSKLNSNNGKEKSVFSILVCNLLLEDKIEFNPILG